MNYEHSVQRLARWRDERLSTPDQAALLLDQITQLLASLEPLQRTIVELSMQNQSTEQIADAVKRSPRTVRREIQRARLELERRLNE